MIERLLKRLLVAIKFLLCGSKFIMKAIRWFSVGFAVLALAGCNGSLYSGRGAKITQPENLIHLQEGNQQGIWKTNELALNYRYQTASEELKISGAVNLLDGAANCCNSVKRLIVRLVFLDAQETVINSVVLYSADSYHPINLIPMNFEGIFPIPPGTAAISFGYNGELGGSGGSSGNFSLWYSPF